MVGMRRESLLAVMCALVLGALGAAWAAEAPVDLAQACARRRVGNTITLPAGTFHGGVTLPSGVSLRGAGYAQTIIDASSVEIGVLVDGGKGARVSDLTVRGARSTGVQLKNAAGVVVSRVVTTAGIIGVSVSGCHDARVENVVSAHNRYGITVNGGQDNVVVNCTVADNVTLGISLSSGLRPITFNNCLSNNTIGIYLGRETTGARVDYNLYFGIGIGKVDGQGGRGMLGPWQALTLLDAHSVQLQVTFRNAAANDYHPVSVLDWALNRATTGDWGTNRLGKIVAPTTDIDGANRIGRPDLGAWETQMTPPRPPDGTLTISADDGIKSAGIFTKDGTEVYYLFQNMPLAKGTYPFWFPARDFQAHVIPAGPYEVRVAESALDWEYLGMVGDTGTEDTMATTAPVNANKLTFDSHGNVVVTCDAWAEDHINMRCYDIATGKVRWGFTSNADVRGVTSGADGMLYALRVMDKERRFSRVDPVTGKVALLPAWGKAEYQLTNDTQPYGLAELDGKLYCADTQAGKVYVGPLEHPDFTVLTAIPSPASVTADRTTHLVWLTSAEKHVVALKPDGTIAAEVTPVAMPAGLAARDGKLAVADRTTNRVYLYDATNPKELKLLATFGQAGGRFGAFAPDRFTFNEQGSTFNLAKPELALGRNGELAVGDGNRLLVFDKTGKSLWSTFGVFGGCFVRSYVNPARRYDGNWSMLLDGANKRWSPEAFWDMSAIPGGVFIGEFPLGGKVFGVFSVTTKAATSPGFVWAQREGYRFVPVLAVWSDQANNRFLMRKDTNHDGKLDEADGTTRFDTDPYNYELFYNQNYLLQHGDILTLGEHGYLAGCLHCAGLDTDGVPIYKYADRTGIPFPPAVVSPYTLQLEAGNHPLRGAAPVGDGEVIGDLLYGSSPYGTGIGVGVTDVARFKANGQMRWLHSLGNRKGLQGCDTAGPITVTGVATTAEVIAMNVDGLGLGSIGLPPAAHYTGFWYDNPYRSVEIYAGPDGHLYVLAVDDVYGCCHWWRVNWEGRLKTVTQPVTLSDAAAKVLAALPVQQPMKTLAIVPPTTVSIPRLAAPLPIDGDPAKWRKTGVSPNIIITPETAGAGITGPLDATVLIRMAYQGKDLYMQALYFDDVVNLSQPSIRYYSQECLEMCLNGFMTGFKFDFTHVSDKGDVVMRGRWLRNDLGWEVPQNVIPHVIKVLDNARDIPERELIEGVYGIDMSKEHVIVMEMKIPMDGTAYKGAETDAIPLKSGQTFWIGFLVDDNDEIGADVQHYMGWPATYGTFSEKEVGAIATLQ